MIKRRFYRQEHVDKNDISDSSSSSSDSDSEADALDEETEAEEQVAAAEAKQDEQHCSPSSGSGYESEDSSANEVHVDSSGLLINDEDGAGIGRQNRNVNQLTSKGNAEIVETKSKIVTKEDSTTADFAGHFLKCKSVFKCRLCPRIVCLTEDTLMAHLKSKRHARSEKLLSEGRLKLMLNSDGEIEEDQETHAERHARTVALTQDLANPKKRNKGRQRQRQRLQRKKIGDGSDKGKAQRKKIGDGSDKGKAKQLMKNPAKRRRRNED